MGERNPDKRPFSDERKLRILIRELMAMRARGVPDQTIEEFVVAIKLAFENSAAWPGYVNFLIICGLRDDSTITSEGYKYVNAVDETPA